MNIWKINGSMTRNEIEKAAGIDKSKAIRGLNRLIEKKMIQKRGLGTCQQSKKINWKNLFQKGLIF